MSEANDLLTQEGLRQFRESVRKEATDKAAKWAVGAVLVLLGFAAAGWWFYLKKVVVDIVGGVPPGTVVAFDQEGCPSGWDRFDVAAGRVVLGMGQGEGLTRRHFREVSPPVESVRLAESNMPVHQHETLIGLSEKGPWGNGQTTRTVAGSSMGVFSVALSSPYGRAVPDPFSIVPPFIALQYCKKQ